MMFVAGYAYFPRWVYDYLPLPEWEMPQMMITAAAYLIGLGFILFVINVGVSASRGKIAPDEPWPVEYDDAEPSAVPAE